MSSNERPQFGINAARQQAAGNRAPDGLTLIHRALEAKPFKPHPYFVSGHAQTLAAFLWPRRHALRAHHHNDQGRIFDVAPRVQLLAHCRWQRDAQRAPTMLLVHGLEGSSEGVYMLSTGAKAYAAGFNVLRLNLRNCGGTEHLTPTLYNSGLSGDLRAVIGELIERDQLRRIFLVGFSMSGNMSLKMAGEDGACVPRELMGVCAISPSVDLSASANAIEQRSNWIYHRNFMISLRRRIRSKKKLYPDLYDTRGLRRVRTLRQFDARYTTVDGGYASVEDYYAHASSRSLIPDIRVPSLIIHAQDDPFIPCAPLLDPSIAANPDVLLITPAHGGHVGFVAGETRGEDRFWAENRTIEFCTLLVEQGASGNQQIVNVTST
jgi:predicted alpha/beta-fold hydrolase